jgi:hypothetical protein
LTRPEIGSGPAYNSGSNVFKLFVIHLPLTMTRFVMDMVSVLSTRKIHHLIGLKKDIVNVSLDGMEINVKHQYVKIMLNAVGLVNVTFVKMWIIMEK